MLEKWTLFVLFEQCLINSKNHYQKKKMNKTKNLSHFLSLLLAVYKKKAPLVLPKEWKHTKFRGWGGGAIYQYLKLTRLFQNKVKPQTLSLRSRSRLRYWDIEREQSETQKWRQLWQTELRAIEAKASWSSLSTSLEASVLLQRITLLLLLHLLRRPRKNPNEKRRRTCSRWLSFCPTGDSDTTWPRLTGLASLTRSPRSISTRSLSLSVFSISVLFRFWEKIIVRNEMESLWFVVCNNAKLSSSKLNSCIRLKRLVL